MTKQKLIKRKITDYQDYRIISGIGDTLGAIHMLNLSFLLCCVIWGKGVLCLTLYNGLDFWQVIEYL